MEQAVPKPTTTSADALEREIAELIVQGLNLPMSAAQIDPEAPLYGDGLGLDSIDILEIALIVSKQYGIVLRPRQCWHTAPAHPSARCAS